MSFLKSYSSSIKIIVAIVTLCLVGWCGYIWTNCSDGITDYNASRDKAAIKKMFHDDWQLLQFGDFDTIKESNFNVDFMLDTHSSSQHFACNDLRLKVVRESGKTVGFLAYYPKSPYWWHMLFLIVDKDHRGKGYASKLVQYFIDDCVRRGAIKLTTFTRVINTPARAVYEGKFGFKNVGDPYIGSEHEGKYLDLLLYPKSKHKK